MAAKSVPLTGVVWTTVLAALLLGGAVPTAAQPPAPDPVAQLEEALRTPRLDPAARERVLRQRIAALHSLPDLRRALGLDAWRDDDPDARLSLVDAGVRGTLVKQFYERVRELLRTGDAETRRAVVVVLGEAGPLGHAPGSRGGMTRALGPDLAALLKHDTPSVRAAAARALGLINPDPEVAVPALAELLRADDAGQRAAATEGLFLLMRFASEFATNRARAFTGVEVTPAEGVAVGRAIVPVAGRALRDASPPVRQRAAESLHQAATVVAKLVSDPRQPEEMENPEDARREFKEEQALVGPLVAALNEQTPQLTRTLSDADLGGCLAANEALEAVADVRHQLLVKATAVARMVGDKPGEVLFSDSLRDNLCAAVRPLGDELSHKNVRVRLAALYVLESLEAEAAPVAAGIVGALGDGDAFVRWAAARVLERMAPHEADQAVPGLARMLDDANGDVRATAVAALERYGPTARAAVPELRRALGRKEAVLRVALLRVVRAIGKAARPAVPEVLTALTAPEAPVRVAAARALGRIGAGDRETREALRRALDDAEADVRQAAADALLAGK
jgi:HEAT repeat protein